MQTGGYIDPKFGESIDVPHFVVVKLGSATIDILGDITATDGFVNALASARNEFDTENLLSLIPLSFGMGDVEAKVTVGGEAQISAGAGARLMSDTFVYVNSYDKGSFPKFNVSLAGNVVTADTKTHRFRQRQRRFCGRPARGRAQPRRFLRNQHGYAHGRAHAHGAQRHLPRRELRLCRNHGAGARRRVP